jgi:hypothetical protein
MFEQIAMIRRPRQEAIIAARILSGGCELLRPVGALPASFRVWYDLEGFKLLPAEQAVPEKKRAARAAHRLTEGSAPGVSLHRKKEEMPAKIRSRDRRKCLGERCWKSHRGTQYK